MSVSSFPWNQANTLSRDFVIPNIQDQWSLSNAFYYRALQKKKMYDGGRKIVAPINWKKEGNGGGWFAGTDKLDIVIRDPIQAAEHYAKNAYVSINIDWDEQMQVAGGQRTLGDLMTVKGEIAKTTLLDLVGTNLFNDGSDAKAITGLAYSLKDFSSGAPTMTYGGISRGAATNTWWNHNGDETAYTTAASGNFDPLGAGKVTGVIGKMWAQIAIASGKKPTMLLSNWGVFTAFHNALLLNDRYMRPQQNSDMYKVGFDNLMYRTATFCVDERAPRTSGKVEKLYFVNEDTVRLYVHSQADMAYEPFRKPVDQMTQHAFILWRGELIVVEPRANGVIQSIDCSAVS